MKKYIFIGLTHPVTRYVIGIYGILTIRTCNSSVNCVLVYSVTFVHRLRRLQLA